MSWTYRTELNQKIDELEMFSKTPKEDATFLERGFYISRDLRTMLKDVPRPLEYFHRNSMEGFAELVWYTRQNVRHAIIVNWRYIFLRQGYYNTTKLIDFLNKFIWWLSKNEK